MSPALPREERDAIRARAEAATPGPWTALTTGRAGGDHWYVCDKDESIASISANDGINEDQREPDAKFIAHARTDAPALLDALDAAEEENERLRAALTNSRAIAADRIEDRDRIARERESADRVERERAVAERLAEMALADSEAFPSSEVAKYVARWIRDDDDDPVRPDGRVLGLVERESVETAEVVERVARIIDPGPWALPSEAGWSLNWPFIGFGETRTRDELIEDEKERVREVARRVIRILYRPEMREGE